MKMQADRGKVTHARRVGQAPKRWSVKDILTDSAEDWNVSPRTILMIWAIPCIIALAGIVAALVSKDLYKWFVSEDGFAESLQVVCYTLALVLSLVLLRHRIQAGNIWITLLYVLLSCGFVFMIGEELSWGQRIVGWETPEHIAAVNKQEETNLHNIHGVGTTFKWMQLVVGAFGTLAPLALLAVPRRGVLARCRQWLSMLVPHYSLIPYFAFLFIWRLYRNFVEPPRRFYFVVSEYNEAMELILALGFLLFVIHQLRKARSAASRPSPASAMIPSAG